MPVGPRPPEVTVAGFEGPLDLLLELVEDKKLDILTVRLGELADEYLARVRAMAALPADEVSAFLYVASRLVLVKARSLLPSLAPASDDDETDTEEELRLRLIEYATTKDRAAALWCENATRLTGRPWSYLKVLQEEYNRLDQPERFAEIAFLSEH